MAILYYVTIVGKQIIVTAVDDNEAESFKAWCALPFDWS
jgi:hypothetical protein